MFQWKLRNFNEILSFIFLGQSTLLFLALAFLFLLKVFSI
ncbi:hypothetical protein PRO82_000787 [Candidatus Protochlamydia amoebophila]|nr:hypothetical protein [Candidatus Protochlamydia amoebophila]